MCDFKYYSLPHAKAVKTSAYNHNVNRLRSGVGGMDSDGLNNLTYKVKLKVILKNCIRFAVEI